MMMKKLICLLLALLMVVPVMVSCSGGGDAAQEVADEASRYTTTLNMWVMTDDNGVDPEQAKLVNDAINKITKAKYKTQLNVIYVKESEYYTKLEKAFQDKEAAIQAEKEAAKADREAQKNGQTVAPKEDATTGDQYKENDWGIPELVYPTAPDYQVDILFLGDYTKYREYADKGWLASLDDKLTESAIKLSYYVSNSLIEGARYDGLVYGIPNNSLIGEYTYLLVDENLMNRLGYTPSDFSSSSIYDTECRKFLDLVYAMDYTSEADRIYPIYSENGKVDLSLVHYWNYDMDSAPGSYILRPDEFSLFGGVFSDTAERGQKISYGNLLADNIYTGMLKTKTHYEGTEGFITTDPNAQSAVRVVTGQWEDKAAYEAQGYTVLTMEKPRVTDETVYSSMFAVGGHSSEDIRAMEIITDLNTNVEFRNLLLYGIEGTHYNLNTVTDDNGKEYSFATLKPNSGYVMDMQKTGNMFLAYPVVDAKLDVEDEEDREKILEIVKVWDNAKKQNLEASTYPTLGMYFAYSVEAKHLRVIEAVSEKVEVYINTNLTTEAAVVAFESAINAYKTNTTGMAEYILTRLLTEPVTYTLDGQSATVTKEDLAAALACMTQTTVDEEHWHCSACGNVVEATSAPKKCAKVGCGKSGTYYIPAQSPYALYLYWRSYNGFE